MTQAEQGPRWEIAWEPHAIRELRRLDIQTRERVVHALERLANTELGDVRRLKGAEGEWRLRVGNWRVRLLRDASTRRLVVLHVLPRSSAYRR